MTASCSFSHAIASDCPNLLNSHPTTKGQLFDNILIHFVSKDSPVQRQRKFSTVLGQMFLNLSNQGWGPDAIGESSRIDQKKNSGNNSHRTRPTGRWFTETSNQTRGFSGPWPLSQGFCSTTKLWAMTTMVRFGASLWTKMKTCKNGSLQQCLML